MIQVNDPRHRGARRGAFAPAAGRTRPRGQDRQDRQRLRRADGGAMIGAVLSGAVLLARCAAGHPGPRHALPRPGPARLVPAAAAAGSLVRVLTPSVVQLRVYASRVTVTTAGRATVSDGVTVQLTRTGGQWLVSAVLFW